MFLIFAGLENINRGYICVEVDGNRNDFNIKNGCKNLIQLTDILNDIFLIDGVQIIEIQCHPQTNKFKGSLSWKKNIRIPLVKIYISPLLALQCGLKKYEEIVNVSSMYIEIDIDENLDTVANLLTGLNVLNLTMSGIFPVYNYCISQIHISDGQLNSLLTDESKVYIRPFSSSFMIDHFNPNGVDFEILNFLNQSIVHAYCNISINVRRVNLKR